MTILIYPFDHISLILPKVMKAIEDKLFEPNKPFTLANKDYRINN